MPVQFITELLGIIEGLGTIGSEVCPGMVIGLGGNRKRRIEILQNLNRVVRGPCIANTDGIGDLERRLNGPRNNTGFILDHIEDDDFNGIGHLFVVVVCWLGLFKLIRHKDR